RRHGGLPHRPPGLGDPAGALPGRRSEVRRRPRGAGDANQEACCRRCPAMSRLIVALAATLTVSAAPAAGATRPNVLIVMTDDQGLGDFSYTANPVLKTPNLDAFARGAVPLTDFHVCPMRPPTRGQLLTGLAALRNGATSVTAGRTFLRPGIPTLADLFGKAGYRTGLFGKWHLGDSYPHRPIDKGFQ